MIIVKMMNNVDNVELRLKLCLHIYDNMKKKLFKYCYCILLDYHHYDDDDNYYYTYKASIGSSISFALFIKREHGAR